MSDAEIISAEFVPKAQNPDTTDKIYLTRDQQRAIWAYTCAENVDKKDQKNYRTLVNDWNANVIRSGLGATIAFVQRFHKKEPAAAVLADFGKTEALQFLPAVAERMSQNQGNLPAAIRSLPTPDYMMATREALKLGQWLKRAVQAIFPEESDSDQDSPE